MQTLRTHVSLYRASEVAETNADSCVLGLTGGSARSVGLPGAVATAAPLHRSDRVGEALLQLHSTPLRALFCLCRQVLTALPLHSAKLAQHFLSH